MEIISINAEHTTDACHVAFNTDQPLSQYAVEKLPSRPVGNFIAVRLDDNGTVIVTSKVKPIDKKDVTNINTQLEVIEKEEKELYQTMLQTRLTILESVKESTGLPLDSTQANSITID